MMGGYGLEKGKEEETGMTSATVAWKKGRMGRRGFPFSPSTRLHPGSFSLEQVKSGETNLIGCN